jgi:hypothetical protein
MRCCARAITCSPTRSWHSGRRLARSCGIIRCPLWESQQLGESEPIIVFEAASIIQIANCLHPAYAGISGILQGHQKDVYKKPLVLDAIHNPLALNALLTGLFGAFKEFVAVENGEDYQLSDVAPALVA